MFSCYFCYMLICISALSGKFASCILMLKVLRLSEIVHSKQKRVFSSIQFWSSGLTWTDINTHFLTETMNTTCAIHFGEPMPRDDGDCVLVVNSNASLSLPPLQSRLCITTAFCCGWLLTMDRI